MIDEGLLKENLKMPENHNQYFKKTTSPLIKVKVAPVFKNQFVPWLKKLTDEELDTIMEQDASGARLKIRINGEAKQ